MFLFLVYYTTVCGSMVTQVVWMLLSSVNSYFPCNIDALE